MNLTLLCKEARKIARKAAKEIIKIYQLDDWDVRSKTDMSPVTAADIASNHIICDSLTKLYPNIPIISEENVLKSYNERKNYEYYWLIDPLDGTKEFIKKNDEFVINIALIHRNKPILGVVYAPVLKECFWAVAGVGAYKMKNGRTAKIRCAPFKSSDAGLRVLVSRSHSNKNAESPLDIFIDPDLIPMGSALKFMSIAKGEADVYCRIGPTMEWDTAAPQIILEEAGGNLFVYNDETHKTAVDAIKGRLPMAYNKEDQHNQNFIAFGRLAC